MSTQKSKTILMSGELTDISVILDALNSIQNENRVSFSPFTVFDEDGESLGTVQFEGEPEAYVFTVGEDELT